MPIYTYRDKDGREIEELYPRDTAPNEIIYGSVVFKKVPSRFSVKFISRQQKEEKRNGIGTMSYKEFKDDYAKHVASRRESIKEAEDRRRKAVVEKIVAEI